VANGDDGPLEFGDVPLPEGAVDPADQQQAEVVAGDVNDLAAAVIDKFVAIVTDRHGTGQRRAEAARTVAMLREIIPPQKANDIAAVFIDVATADEQQPLDALAFLDRSVGRPQVEQPAREVAGDGAAAAAQLYVAAASARDPELAGRIINVAGPMLRSDRDRDSIAAAWALSDLADTEPAPVSLVSHRLPAVRQLAMRTWDRTGSKPVAVAAQLPQDRSPRG
jgi:hypothetical protein